MVLLFCAGAWAQSGVSQVSGTVRAPGGLVVPAAQVTVTRTPTGLTRTVQTNTERGYIIPSLPVGPYRVNITKEGFRAYTQSGIVLQVDSNPVLDATLPVGSITQEISVQADASMVETHSTGVGQVVDQQRVVELPLNGRHATQLIFLAGAATTAEGGLNTNKNGRAESERNHHRGEIGSRQFNLFEFNPHVVSWRRTVVPFLTGDGLIPAHLSFANVFVRCRVGRKRRDVDIRVRKADPHAPLMAMHFTVVPGVRPLFSHTHRRIVDTQSLAVRAKRHQV